MIAASCGATIESRLFIYGPTMKCKQGHDCLKCDFDGIEYLLMQRYYCATCSYSFLCCKLCKIYRGPIMIDGYEMSHHIIVLHGGLCIGNMSDYSIYLRYRSTSGIRSDCTIHEYLRMYDISCIICFDQGFTYDCFPSREMVIAHVNSCCFAT